MLATRFYMKYHAHSVNIIKNDEIFNLARYTCTPNERGT